MSMNIHHLELFYHVARNGGISEAVRNMPYGIQQPAVSSQVIQLEQYLGVTLFHRRPFSLTPAGRELYAFAAPFFGRLDEVARKLQGGMECHLRIGASEVVLRDHIPAIALWVREKYPSLQFTLKEGDQSQIEQWLEKQEIDMAFTLLGDRCDGTVSAVPLLKIPLMLIVPKDSPIRSAETLWGMDPIKETLISLPAHEALSRTFQKGLSAKGVDWFPGIEVSSLALIETYVANGFGIGLFLDMPGKTLSPQVRAIPLEAFAPLIFGVMWRGTSTPVMDAFVEAVRVRAGKLGAALEEKA